MGRRDILEERVGIDAFRVPGSGVPPARTNREDIMHVDREPKTEQTPKQLCGGGSETR